MFKFLNNIFNENKIKYFKSDNGREYNKRKILEFCKNNGIRKIYSPPYNPENNGLAERFNQTIISCAKTLLFWSKLSEYFWDFAVTYANYIYNKVPHSGIDNKIPEEIFYNKKVNLKYIKVFSCIAYYKDYSQDKGKFNSNANKGIFLGFDEQSYSYLIMDYENFKMHRVREIQCIEDEPTNISLSDNVTNDLTNSNFLNFNFINNTQLTNRSNFINTVYIIITKILIIN